MKRAHFFPAYVALIVWTVWAVYMDWSDSWYLFEENWFMSMTMALGSFIAGATSEGGGAVAFPAMTLLFEIHPSVAREFSLMIQSVGMTAAALTIIVLKIKVVWRVVFLVSMGGIVGVVLGIEIISPLMSPPIVKLFFTSLWLSFGFVLFWINRHTERSVREEVEVLNISDTIRFICVGLLGGIVSGIAGSGLDIITFSLLVLFYRTCETIATPTSVVLMAVNSLSAFFWMQMFGSGVSIEAWNYWLVCIPIVVVGAPLGAWFIRNKSRVYVARILYVSIVCQYVGALLVLPMNAQLFMFSGLVIVVGLLFFLSAIYFGRKSLEGQ